MVNYTNELINMCDSLNDLKNRFKNDLVASYAGPVDIRIKYIKDCADWLKSNSNLISITDDHLGRMNKSIENVSQALSSNNNDYDTIFAAIAEADATCHSILMSCTRLPGNPIIAPPPPRPPQQKQKWEVEEA